MYYLCVNFLTLVSKALIIKKNISVNISQLKEGKIVCLIVSNSL